MKDIFLNYLSEFVLIIGGVFSFFAGRKLHKSEEKASQLQNIEKIRLIEKRLLSDMEETINKLMKNNDDLEAIIDKQANKILEYRKKFGEL